MKKLVIGIAIVLMLILSLCFLSWSGLIRVSPAWSFAPNYPHLKSLVLNRKANQLFKAENFSLAFDNYIKTLELDPFSAETHLNLGLTYESQQQMDKVMPSYVNAEKYAQNDEMKFMAYFNQAQLLGKEKKVDEALELYQKALTMDPTSKETKHNIELLIQTKQQEQKGGGESKDQDNKDQDKKDQQDKQDQKDKKDQDKKDQDKKDQEQDPKDGKDKKKDEPREYKKNGKPQPRPFKGKELSEGDVKKILGEIKQQEQKIRSEYNRKEVKEQPRGKDW